MHHMEVATGLSPSTIRNRLRVSRSLSPQLLHEFKEGRLSTMEAERLAKHTDPSKQEKELERGPRYRRLDVPKIRSLLEACETTSKRSVGWKQGAVAALRYVLLEEEIPDDLNR